jgi:3-hydroxybutyryl-CoA dehydratase
MNWSPILVRTFCNAVPTKIDKTLYQGGFLKIGHYATISKIFTDKDVQTFSELSQDHNPLHLSDEYASKTKFKRRIVHGFLYASLISAVAGTILPGPGSVYVRQEIQFKKPVYIGDEITAEVILLEIDLRRRVGKFQTNCYNSNKELVLEGEALVKIPQEKIESSTLEN